MSTVLLFMLLAPAHVSAASAAVSFAVASDPGGHRPFVESGGTMPDRLEVTVRDGAITIGGASPFVPVSGTVDAGGSVTAVGTGTVAGFSGTAVAFDGTYVDGVLDGTYRLGTNGVLPGGQPITYTVTAAGALIVNTTADVGDGVCDAGHCSLRDAIMVAVGRAGHDTISFDLTDADRTIRLLTPLPALSDAITISGRSAGTPRIELDGSLAGTGADGLVLSGAEALVQDLIVNRFDGAGIRATGPGRYTLEGNIIGTDAGATVDLGNGMAGVHATGEIDLTLRDNTIAFNGGGGITVDATSGAIDLTLTGNTLTANRGHGMRSTISVEGSVTVGGATAADGNTISGDAELGAGFTLSGPIDLSLDLRHNVIAGGSALRVTQDSEATLTLTSANNTLQGSLLGADLSLGGEATVTVTGGTATGGATAAVRLGATPITGKRIRLSLDGHAIADAGTDGIAVSGSGDGALELSLVRTTIARSGGDAVSVDVSGTLDAAVRMQDSTFEASGNAGVRVRATSGRLRLDLGLKGNTFRANRHGLHATGGAVEVGLNFGLSFSTAAETRRALTIAGANQFTENTDTGVLADGSVVALDGDVLTANGTGVIAQGGATVTLTGVTVSASRGAGVDVRDSSIASLTDSLISGNAAEGVRSDPGATVSLTGNTIEGNDVGVPAPAVDFTGDVATNGVSAIVLNRPAAPDALAAATDARSLWVTIEGVLVGYVPGAPAFVNAAVPAPLETGAIVLVVR